jgi:hypothetical protein
MKFEKGKINCAKIIIKKNSYKMFEAYLNDGYIFKKIIDSIKDVVDSANLYVTKDGL